MKTSVKKIISFGIAFALLLSLSIPAYAVADPLLAYASIDAGVAVAGTLQALGISAGNQTETFEDVVVDAVEHLHTVGNFVVDGSITMAGIKSPDTGLYRSYVQESLAQTLLQWVFDVELVKQRVFQNPIPEETYVPNNYKYAYLATWRDTRDGSFTYRYCYSNNGPIYLYISSDGTVRVKCDYTWLSNTPQNSMFTSHKAGETLGFHTYLSFVSFEPFGTLNPPSYGSERDISVSEIQTPFVGGLAVPLFDLESYSPWTKKAVAVPLPGLATDEDWVPVSIGGTSVNSDVLSGTQVGAQVGSVVDGVVWSDSAAVPDSVTLADVITAVLSIPASIVEGIGNLLFPAVDGLTMSLTEFFPFCIPYDLYEFFTLLRAEPEAPVFKWEIPVPQLGRNFEIEVDLSAWDSVAQLFRNLELMAFIVGLAYVTREKFLRS